MTKQKQEIGIKESFGIIKKSDSPATPLTEGLINSLDAIKQRQNREDVFTPQITISLAYQTNKNLLGEETRDISSISIEDNGIGFVEKNLERLKKLADRTKGQNNRGTGKIQMFHRFEELTVDSTFFEDEKYNNLKLKYTINDDVTEEVQIISDTPELKTIIKMNRFYGDETEKSFFESYIVDINLLKRDIFARVLLRLFLEKDTGISINLKIYLDSNLILEDSIKAIDIPAPDKTDKVKIDTYKLLPTKKDKEHTTEWEISNSDEVLEINRFKLPANSVEGNEVQLCSKNIMIERFPFSAIKKKAEFDGYRYLTSVSGNIFDKEDNVSHTGDGFNFPIKKNVDKKIEQGDLFNPSAEYIFWDEIKDKLNSKLTQLYSDVKTLKEKKEEDIVKIAKKYGISVDMASEIKVELSDSDERVAEKLFERQAKHFAQRSIEINKTYEQLIALEAQELDPSSEDYEKQFSETSEKLLTLIPEQNKDELARYIIRRDIIVRVLRLALNKELSKQKEWARKKALGEDIREDQEGIIHDLIFKRKTKGLLNELWILNEEFTHFQGCSDLPLDQLEVDGYKFLRDNIDIKEALKSVGLDNNKLKKRPDIFLFPEEGKCILIEFKAPDEDLSLYSYQIPKYAALIANYARNKVTQFYGFLIGENIDKTGVQRFNKAIKGGYWFVNDPVKDIETEIQIADLYQEVIPLSIIASRAEFRNKSFAQKLGLTGVLEEAQKVLDKEADELASEILENNV